MSADFGTFLFCPWHHPVGSIITKLATNAAGEEVSAKDATGDAANLCHDSKGEIWEWLSGEQMNNR